MLLVASLSVLKYSVAVMLSPGSQEILEQFLYQAQ